MGIVLFDEEPEQGVKIDRYHKLLGRWKHGKRPLALFQCGVTVIHLA